MLERRIWIVWFDGFEAAPPLIRGCAASWQQHNPDYQVELLDAHSLARWVDLEGFDIEDKLITPAALSDLVRLELLDRYGGIWVDATVLCNQPVGTWLVDHLSTGFFAFSDPGPGRPLASWFIACAAGHPLVRAWRAAAVSYWQDRDRADQYFWLHALFDGLIAGSRSLAQRWNQVPKMSADGPHSFQEHDRMYSQITAAAETDSAGLPVPLFKLTWRYDPKRVQPNSIIARTYSESNELDTTQVSTGPLTATKVIKPTAPSSFLPPPKAQPDP